jgi:hypothetical protein
MVESRIQTRIRKCLTAQSILVDFWLAGSKLARMSDTAILLDHPSVPRADGSALARAFHPCSDRLRWCFARYCEFVHVRMVRDVVLISQRTIVTE